MPALVERTACRPDPGGSDLPRRRAPGTRSCRPGRRRGQLPAEEDDRVLTELAARSDCIPHDAQLDTAPADFARRAQATSRRTARVKGSNRGQWRRRAPSCRAAPARWRPSSTWVGPGGHLRLGHRNVLLEDPQAAVEMLDELGTAGPDTIQELPSSRMGIYPPLGRQRPRRGTSPSGQPGSPLDVEPGRPRGSGVTTGDIEAPIYFCCPRKRFRTRASTLRTRTSRYASGRSREDCCFPSPTTAPGLGRAAAQHGPRIREHDGTAWVPSAARCAGGGIRNEGAVPRSGLGALSLTSG